MAGILIISVLIPTVLFFALVRRDQSIPDFPSPQSSQPGEQQAAGGGQVQEASPTRHPEAVGAFYDATTSDFLKVYGEFIQAFRTRDLDDLADYQISAMGLQPGMRVLDAGCGVCGPALAFARKAGVEVDALTVSQVQVSMAQERIQAAGMEAQVRVRQGDYHEMERYLPEGQYDVVYFLESFGHSDDKAKALASAWKMLKPGGLLYIKDLFLREALDPVHQPVMDREVNRINEAYHYHIGDLHAVLSDLRRNGWILSHLKTVDIPLEQFENLSISNDFQELTGIGKIDSWQDYIFPVDFFELHCRKPWMGEGIGDSRYFLQNLYYRQVKGHSEEEIAKMRME